MTSNMTRVWLALLAIVIFIGGMTAGGLRDRWNTRPRGSRMGFRAPGPGGGPRDGFRGSVVGKQRGRPLVRLANALELTGEQREQLEALFDEERDRMRSGAEDARARAQSAQQERRDRLVEILTPEQREQFDKFKLRPQRSRKDFRRGRQRRGPGRGF